MSPEEVRDHFTAPDGCYHFARWRRPIVPVVFGLEDAALAVVKGALEAVVLLAGHKMAQSDPEQGANLLIFFLAEWDEIAQVPDLAHLVPEAAALSARLAASGAGHYRLFRFDPDGAIRAAVVFVRMGGALAQLPAEEIALHEAARIIVLWQGQGEALPLLGRAEGRVILRPGIAALIRASYDPVLPPASRDASHALRLAARLPA